MQISKFKQGSEKKKQIFEELLIKKCKPSLILRKSKLFPSL